MKNLIIITVLALSLQGCSVWKWFTDTTYGWGESMPVKDGVQRCEDKNFCFGKRTTDNQPYPAANLSEAPYQPYVQRPVIIDKPY